MFESSINPIIMSRLKSFTFLFFGISVLLFSSCGKSYTSSENSIPIDVYLNGPMRLSEGKIEKNDSLAILLNLINGRMPQLNFHRLDLGDSVFRDTIEIGFFEEFIDINDMGEDLMNKEFGSDLKAFLTAPKGNNQIELDSKKTCLAINSLLQCKDESQKAILEKNLIENSKGNNGRILISFLPSRLVIPPLDINGPDGDLDGDGVINKDDQCPNEKGEAQCSGCPCPEPVKCPDGDSDKDGICNSEDKCPNEFGTKKYGGCKIPDSDGDGYNDEIDTCSNESSRCCGGCPDKDGDGVLDKDDDCDDVAGDASNKGCPKISIQFQKEIGQFLVTVSSVNKYKAYISAKQQNGTEITYEMDVFNDFTFGGPEIRPEFTSKFKSFYARLDPPDHLLVTVKVYDLNKKLLLTSSEYREMSIVCFEENLCGFKSVRD